MLLPLPNGHFRLCHSDAFFVCLVRRSVRSSILGTRGYPRPLVVPQHQVPRRLAVAGDACVLQGGDKKSATASNFRQILSPQRWKIVPVCVCVSAA